MSRNHIMMHKVKEILRLRFDYGYSYEDISKSVGVGKTTVSECLRRFEGANLRWSADLTETELELKLYPPQKTSENQKGQIDWEYIHKELKRKSVTLQLLWSEYKDKNIESLSYSQFCRNYNIWKKPLDVWMHQTHKAGEKCFVDYAGQTMPVMSNAETGEIREAQIFVGVLGASKYTYAEATWTQTLPDWINSHINMFEYFKGCSEILVPDNLKSGVIKCHLYEPDINRTYQDMARHYGAVVIPARPKKPKDKALAESGVFFVERFILAKFRDRTFLSLLDLNEALKVLVEDLNRKPFQKLEGCRLSHFEELDKPALKALPGIRYEYAEWKKVRVGFNYHVEIEGHSYSVPFKQAKEEVCVRYTSKTVEIFYKNNRIASHIRNYQKYGYTTDKTHMPKNHQKQAEWTSDRLLNWAQKIGEATEKLIEAVMKSRPHPEQAFKSCLGIMRLGKSYGDDRLEKACWRALHIGAHSYKSIESILKTNLDFAPLPVQDLSEDQEKVQESHEYIRGKSYFA